MRYTPTLKLSTRLIAFVTVIVISAMFILFVGGALSFKRMGQEYLTHSLYGIVEVIDKELDNPDSANRLQQWMPQMLRASNIIEMKLSSPGGVIYHFKNTSSHVPPERLRQRVFPLEHNDGYQVEFQVLPPYLGYSYSIQAMWSITLAIVLVIFCLLRGVKWLKEQLIGSELLEERGRMILAGRVEEYAKGDEREWPYTASDALDTLISELQYARQERSRFDTFIRTQTFLDKLTGSANRVLFDNKLESTLQENGARGIVVLMRIQDLPLVIEEHSKKVADDFIVSVGNVISNLIQRYPEAVFSRYYQSDFAIFIPQLSSKDAAALCTQCLRRLDKLMPPTPIDSGNWCHVGITRYREGERQNVIMEEAELALKSAQLLNHNGWNRYEKWGQTEEEEVRGSVKWRTIFDTVLKVDSIILFSQPAYLIGDSDGLQCIHNELTCRINDPGMGIVKASRFLSALKQVGYEAQMDRAVLTKALTWLKESDSSELCYSINLHVVPFAQRSYVRWLRDEMLQLPRAMRCRLSFEFVEGNLVRHLDYMRPVTRMLHAMGSKIIVDQAGRTVVSTHYLKDLRVDYLKLHRSLVKRIDQRHENQLFVNSMIGATENAQTQVIAVGVENQKEWDTLIELGVDGGQGRYFLQEKQLLPPPNTNSEFVNSRRTVKPGKRNRWRRK